MAFFVGFDLRRRSTNNTYKYLVGSFDGLTHCCREFLREDDMCSYKGGEYGRYQEVSECRKVRRGQDRAFCGGVCPFFCFSGFSAFEA